MRNIFLFGPKRAIDQVQKDLHLALDVVVKSARELDQTHQETKELTQSVGVLANRLAELTENGIGPSGWRALRQWLYVIGLTACAVLAAMTGTAAFRGVPALLTEAPIITLGLDLKSPLETPSAVPLAVKIVYYGEGNDVAYFVAVPKKYAGRAFTIRLERGAEINNFEPYEFGADGYSIRDGECHADMGLAEGCQYISGRFPNEANYRVTPCKPTADAKARKEEASDYVAVEITGSLKKVRRTDRFHAAVTLAEVGGVFEKELPDAGYSSASISQCSLFVKNPWTDAPTFSVQPDVVRGRLHYWDSANRDRPSDDEDYDDNIVIASRDIDAEQWGSVYIAMSGASLALAFCFFPLAYTSTGAWRKKRRRGES